MTAVDCLHLIVLINTANGIFILFKRAISNGAEKQYLSLSTHLKRLAFNNFDLGSVCSLQVSETADAML